VNEEQPYTVCYASEMDYSPISDEIGIVAVFSMEEPPGDPDNPPNEELHYYHKSTGTAEWSGEVVDDSQPSITFASVKFHPTSGLPSIAYARGYIFYSITDPVIETEVTYTEFDPVSGWGIVNLPGERYTEGLDFDFDRGTGEPVIVFSNSLWKDLPTGGQAPLTDAASFERAGENWFFSSIKESTSRLEGLTLILEYYGLDSQVCFSDSGEGAYAYVYLEVRFDAESMTWMLLTEVQKSYRELGWSAPFTVTDSDFGASAISLALNGKATHVSFVAIGQQTDPLIFTYRNDYISGSLAYYRD